MTAGTQLRDQGVADVLAADTAPHRGYGPLAREAVPHSPNTLPAVIARASQTGRIVVVGSTRPKRASRHGNRNLVWRAS